MLRGVNSIVNWYMVDLGCITEFGYTICCPDFHGKWPHCSFLKQDFLTLIDRWWKLVWIFSFCLGKDLPEIGEGLSDCKCTHCLSESWVVFTEPLEISDQSNSKHCNLCLRFEHFCTSLYPTQSYSTVMMGWDCRPKKTPFGRKYNINLSFLCIAPSIILELLSSQR